MRNGFFHLLLLLITLFSYASTCFANAELLSIDFFQVGEVSKIEFSFTAKAVKAKKFHVVEDRQIILDLKGVTAKERVLRGFDTSEFSGSVVFVSPYVKDGDDAGIRVAIQLRDNSRSILETQDNKIILSIENRFGVFTQRDLIERHQVGSDLREDRGISKLNIPKSEKVSDILENLTLSGRKKYIGKKISINVKDISMSEILKMIAETSGFNIILSNEVKSLPKITLTLTNIAWDQALDTILSIGKLVARKNGNILMVTTLAKATQEKKLEIQALALSKKEEPLLTKIFPVSYASITDILPIINDYLTEKRGKVKTDKRTNSIIVKDTVDVIERIRKIIETLDTATPQILIESKIVEVSESYSKEIGLPTGINFGYDPIGVSGGDVAAVGASGDITNRYSGPGFSFSSAPIAGESARNLMSFTVGRWSRLLNLNFSLQLMESESKGKVISSPKVITQNNTAATISSTDTTSFRTRTTDTSGQISESFTPVTATLSLTVTPQVTNEGSIALVVALNKSGFSGTRPSPDAPPDQTNKTVSTSVLVDNGSTIVLGGIYTFDKSEAHSGIPFLKDIPLIGWLFRTSWSPQHKKNELIIFLTPRIINQEEAGFVDTDNILPSSS